jgi:endonuclease G, mitochondrial
MSDPKKEQVQSYLKLIAAGMGGVEAVLSRLEDLAPRTVEGIESAPSASPMVDSARRGLEAIDRGRDLRQDEIAGIEAIIIPELRPVYDIVDGTYAGGHPLWAKLDEDAAIRRRIEGVLPSVGRIELPGFSGVPYGGTGFVIGPSLLMTNRHVAEIFAHGLGSRAEFIAGRRAGIDFLREHGRSGTEFFDVKAVRMIHPYWDMALLEVDGLSASHGVLRLALDDARDLTGREVVVIGYPAFDSRNPADVQNDLLGGRFGVKKLQPGMLQGGFDTESHRKIVRAATHDCSTLGGNSGSAVVDISTGDVLALHFGGRFAQRNYAVPAGALARDSRVVDAGVVFNAKAPGDPNDWGEWWQRADTEGAHEPEDGNGPGNPGVAPASSVSGPSTGGASLSITVPLHITVSLGGGQGTASTLVIGETPAAADSLEAMREPFHEENFEERNGYDPDFLSGAANLPPASVPMPRPADKSVVALTRDGADTLRYQNFSVMMHARRRLALLTASNVSREPALRRPEAGRDYSRRGLSGLGLNDREKWFPDPRLSSDFQLPDIFFTNDHGAFDKGHIVRRDDVAFGPTYTLLRRANGDTYYGTNCSPQVRGYNQSTLGEANWGDLENHVLAEAASERLCVFAGPVLSDDDRIFEGKGAGGAVIRARIPGSFWKVIAARTMDGIATYGFVLDQDLSDVPLEFTVAPDFLPTMKPIAAIEKLSGVVFDGSLHESDQFGTVRGLEVALRTGTR